MSFLLTNQQWAEARQKDFRERPNAVAAFWPEMKHAFQQLASLEPAKSHIIFAPEDENPHLFVLSAGLFDLKLAADPLSDTVFYAFTSKTLKKLVPSESAIYHYGQLKLARGIWGVIDSPGDEVHKIFADDPQTVRDFPLANRFAQWALDTLLGGYPAVVALEEAASAKAEADERAARKEAQGAGNASEPERAA